MRRASSFIFALALLFRPTPTDAHHAFAAEFAATSPVTLTGTVNKVSWLNPHARFYATVKDLRGVNTQWEFVLGSPNLLIRQGWERTFLKSGDRVTVTGFQARDGSHLASVRTVRMPDGRVVNFGSAGDGGPER
jgi:hypothetical protein